jgi:hypothetical protein
VIARHPDNPEHSALRAGDSDWGEQVSTLAQVAEEMLEQFGMRYYHTDMPFGPGDAFAISPEPGGPPIAHFVYVYADGRKMTFSSRDTRELPEDGGLYAKALWYANTANYYTEVAKVWFEPHVIRMGYALPLVPEGSEVLELCETLQVYLIDAVAVVAEFGRVLNEGMSADEAAGMIPGRIKYLRDGPS